MRFTTATSLTPGKRDEGAKTSILADEGRPVGKSATKIETEDLSATSFLEILWAVGIMAGKTSTMLAVDESYMRKGRSSDHLVAEFGSWIMIRTVYIPATNPVGWSNDRTWTPDDPSRTTVLIAGEGVAVESRMKLTLTSVVATVIGILSMLTRGKAVVREIGPRTGIGWTNMGETSSFCMNSNSTDMHGSSHGTGVMVTRFIPGADAGDRNSTKEVRGSLPGGRTLVVPLGACTDEEPSSSSNWTMTLETSEGKWTTPTVTMVSPRFDPAEGVKLETYGKTAKYVNQNVIAWSVRRGWYRVTSTAFWAALSRSMAGVIMISWVSPSFEKRGTIVPIGVVESSGSPK